MLDRAKHDDESQTRLPATDVRPVARNRRFSLVRAIVQFVLVLLILTAGVVGMQTLIDSRTAPEGRERSAPVYPVEAMTAAPGRQQPTITTYGEAVAARQVELRPLVSGEIVSINEKLSAGQAVGAGETLVTIDAFAFEGALRDAQAAVAQTQAAIEEINARGRASERTLQTAQNQLAFAQSDLERAQTLRDRGQITDQSFEQRQLLVSQREQTVADSEAELATLRAQREQQRASLTRQEWLVSQAERNLANTELKVPFDAIVRSTSVEVGRGVNSSDVIATLYSDDQIEARFTLSDSQYGRLSTDEAPIVGRPVEAVWTIGGERYLFEGTIERIGAEVNAASGGVELFAELRPVAESQVALRPGAFLTISVPDKTFTDAYSVPESAVYDGDRIYVVEEGELQQRQVRVVAYDGNRAILTEGLEPGEVMMTTRLSEAMEGTAVDILSLDGEPVASSSDKAGDRAETASARDSEAQAGR